MAELEGAHDWTLRVLQCASEAEEGTLTLALALPPAPVGAPRSSGRAPDDPVDAPPAARASRFAPEGSGIWDDAAAPSPRTTRFAPEAMGSRGNARLGPQHSDAPGSVPTPAPDSFAKPRSPPAVARGGLRASRLAMSSHSSSPGGGGRSDDLDPLPVSGVLRIREEGSRAADAHAAPASSGALRGSGVRVVGFVAEGNSIEFSSAPASGFGYSRVGAEYDIVEHGEVPERQSGGPGAGSSGGDGGISMKAEDDVGFKAHATSDVSAAETLISTASPTQVSSAEAPGLSSEASCTQDRVTSPEIDILTSHRRAPSPVLEPALESPSSGTPLRPKVSWSTTSREKASNPMHGWWADTAAIRTAAEGAPQPRISRVPDLGIPDSAGGPAEGAPPPLTPRERHAYVEALISKLHALLCAGRAAADADAAQNPLRGVPEASAPPDAAAGTGFALLPLSQLFRAVESQAAPGLDSVLWFGPWPVDRSHSLHLAQPPSIPVAPGNTPQVLKPSGVKHIAGLKGFDCRVPGGVPTEIPALHSNPTGHDTLRLPDTGEVSTAVYIPPCTGAPPIAISTPSYPMPTAVEILPTSSHGLGNTLTARFTRTMDQLGRSPVRVGLPEQGSSRRLSWGLPPQAAAPVRAPLPLVLPAILTRSLPA